MKKILVGGDGSDGAADAIRWAAGLAERAGAELIVMTGFVPVESELPPHRVEALLAEQEAELESWSQLARGGDVDVRTVIERGDPRPGILAAAERESADLIVVGRVGRSAGPGVLHLGSMVEWLAHHTDRPMAVVGGDANRTTRTVVVGVDGSEGSRQALEWLRDMFDGADLAVVAVTVTSEGPGEDDAAAVAADLAADVLGGATDLDVSTRPGPSVASALLDEATERSAELVVLGTRGLGGFTGLRIGGVALKVLHQADRPVVLVPTAPES